MSKRAVVAYEARKKNAAVKPLRWHRNANGSYSAKGARSSYTIFHRSPDRRHGRFPWVATHGGMRGDELKAGGFDRVDQAKEYAALFDAGLCGAAPVAGAVVGAVAGATPGTFRGTLAERTLAERATNHYRAKVLTVLDRVGVPEGSEVDEDYIARMEVAGVDPAITAAVLAGTLRHSHVHDSPGKHVEVFEAGEARRQHHIFRGQRVDIFSSGGTWAYQLADGTGRGGFPSEEAAWAAAQQALGMPAGFSIAVEGAEEAKKRLWQPDPSKGIFLTHSSVTRDTWVMKGDRLLFRGSRTEAEDFAKNYDPKG